MSPPTRLIHRSLFTTLAVFLLAATPAVRAEEAGKAVIRISAGATAEHKDAEGHTWLADQGFIGGDVIDRDSDMKIANTTIPTIYRTEHYGMDGFTYQLPNGKYTVKLHFAETYEGIDGAGQRVFSFNVEGHDFKDFDVFVKSGGLQRALVVTVEVEITDGKLDLAFTSNIENPEINGIEIIPAA